ncbi:MAG: PEP-utilizing enzyme, partial [Hyphomicrobium sp.]
VGFTRNPSDGSDALYIDYLANAQGEDVVAGRRNALGVEQLQRRAPGAYQELAAHKEVLEKTFGDMQDFEFTIEDGKLYMLQTRSGKRTPLAALRIAHDLVADGIIAAATAVERLAGLDLEDIEYRDLIVPEGVQPIAQAVSAGTGVAVGAAVFDPARVKALKRDTPVLLLRENAETADVAAIAEADALITARGARTSHAAVVARHLGKVCLVGCSALQIDVSGRSCRLGEATIREGDVLSIDGASGCIYAGRLSIRRAKPTALLSEIESWAQRPHSGVDEKSEKGGPGSKNLEPSRRGAAAQQRNFNHRDKKMKPR